LLRSLLLRRRRRGLLLGRLLPRWLLLLRGRLRLLRGRRGFWRRTAAGHDQRQQQRNRKKGYDGGFSGYVSHRYLTLRGCEF